MMSNDQNNDSKELKKQILIDSDLHAPFKSYCSSVEKKPVKAVVSEMIRNKLSDSGFKILTKSK
jgi:hypothetical protein